MIFVNSGFNYRLCAILCVTLIKGGYSCELKEQELMNNDGIDGYEIPGNGDIEPDSCASVIQTGKDELSEAKLETPDGGSKLNEVVVWDAAESPHLWKKASPLLKRRVEIHPKCEEKVTLSQIEKECEESMRKQLKENQHKKKLQFSLIGKRDSAGEWSLPNKSQLYLNELLSSKDKKSSCQLADKVLKNESDIKGSFNGYRRMLVGDVTSSDRNSQAKVTNNNLLLVDNSPHSPFVTENSVTNVNETQNSQDIKPFKADTPNNQKSDSNEPGQTDKETKSMIKGLNDNEDRDLKLLKLLYEGLSSKDTGMNDVKPLVKTLKDIADKKIAMNMITFSNITAKPVGMRDEDKVNDGQMKFTNELYNKIKEYKAKNQDKKIFHHFGSSPLNPSLINSKKDTLYPISKSFSTVPKKTFLDINSYSKKNNLVISNLLNSENADSSKLTSLSTLSETLASDNKSMNDYSAFVQLIDKILGTICENNTETSELLNDLNRKLLGTKKDLGSYKMLEGLVRDFRNSVSKIKGSQKAMNGGEDHNEELMRNVRDIETFRDRLLERKSKDGQNPGKIDQTTQNSLSKRLNKSWSKSDELKRLQKVATELKCKIDDLLTNLDATISDEEEADDDEDEDDEDEDEESIRQTYISPNCCNGISTGRGRNKVSDPFESFKKFKSIDNKLDKRKFKEYEPKRKLHYKVISNKQPITMRNRYKTFEDMNKNRYKYKRDKRDDTVQKLYDKYDICNYKSSKKMNIYENGEKQYDNIFTVPNKYTYNNSENNFNVVGVTNELQKIHRNMVDNSFVDSSLHRPIIEFQKYLGNNQQSRGGESALPKTTSNKLFFRRIPTSNIGNELMGNDGDNHWNKTDTPQWLDYGDTEIQGKYSSNMINDMKKNSLKSYNNCFNNLQHYRKQRSLKDLFDYLNMNTVDDKVQTKAVSSQVKSELSANSKINSINDNRTGSLSDISESSKSRINEQPQQ